MLLDLGEYCYQHAKSDRDWRWRYIGWFAWGIQIGAPSESPRYAGAYQATLRTPLCTIAVCVAAPCVGRIARFTGLQLSAPGAWWGRKWAGRWTLHLGRFSPIQSHYQSAYLSSGSR